MAVNTSNCKFNSTPVYFVSMAGVNSHDGITGYNAIYVSSNIKFTIYVLSTVGWNSSQLLNYAATNEWNINWIGFYY